MADHPRRSRGVDAILDIHTAWVLSLRRLEVEAALEGHIQNLQIFNGERLDLARLSKLRVVYLDRAIHAATVLHRCGAVMVRMIPEARAGLDRTAS